MDLLFKNNYNLMNGKKLGFNFTKNKIINKHGFALIILKMREHVDKFRQKCK